MKFNKKQHQKEVLKANFWLVVNQFAETLTGKIVLSLMVMGLLIVLVSL